MKAQQELEVQNYELKRQLKDLMEYADHKLFECQSGIPHPGHHYQYWDDIGAIEWDTIKPTKAEQRAWRKAHPCDCGYEELISQIENLLNK